MSTEPTPLAPAFTAYIIRLMSVRESLKTDKIKKNILPYKVLDLMQCKLNYAGVVLTKFNIFYGKVWYNTFLLLAILKRFLQISTYL